MERVLRLIADYQWWIYGFLALVLLFYLRRAIVARREGARSIFALEQEQARGRYRQSVMFSAFILLLLVSVFVVVNPVLPEPPVELTSEPTATTTTGPLTASTLTPTPQPATMTPTGTATLVRPTRPIRPTDTPEVLETETPVVRPAACPNLGVQISSPGINQVIRGNVAVRGVATVPNFQYYKVEVGPGRNPRDHEWTVVGQLHSVPVSGGVLETFNGSAYAPGTYTLRLVVVDKTGNYPEPCRVTVTLQR